jgi:hypothetical protein
MQGIESRPLMIETPGVANASHCVLRAKNGIKPDQLGEAFAGLTIDLKEVSLSNE